MTYRRRVYAAILVWVYRLILRARISDLEIAGLRAPRSSITHVFPLFRWPREYIFRDITFRRLRHERFTRYGTAPL